MATGLLLGGLPILGSLLGKLFGGGLEDDRELMSKLQPGDGAAPAVESIRPNTTVDYGDVLSVLSPGVFTSQQTITNNIYPESSQTRYQNFTVNDTPSQTVFSISSASEYLNMRSIFLILTIRIKSEWSTGTGRVHSLNTWFGTQNFWASFYDQIVVKINGYEVYLNDSGTLLPQLYAYEFMNSSLFTESGAFDKLNYFRRQSHPFQDFPQFTRPTAGDGYLWMGRVPFPFLDVQHLLAPNTILEVTFNKRTNYFPTVLMLNDYDTSPFVIKQLKSDIGTTSDLTAIDTLNVGSAVLSVDNPQLIIHQVPLPAALKTSLMKPVALNQTTFNVDSLVFVTKVKDIEFTIGPITTSGGAVEPTWTNYPSITLNTTGPLPDYIMILPVVTYQYTLPHIHEDPDTDVQTIDALVSVQHTAPQIQPWRVIVESISINGSEYHRNPLCKRGTQWKLHDVLAMRKYSADVAFGPFNSSTRISHTLATQLEKLNENTRTAPLLVEYADTAMMWADHRHGVTLKQFEIIDKNCPLWAFIETMDTYGPEIVGTRQVADMSLVQPPRAGAATLNLHIMNEPQVQPAVEVYGAQTNTTQDTQRWGVPLEKRLFHLAASRPDAKYIPNTSGTPLSVKGNMKLYMIGMTYSTVNYSPSATTIRNDLFSNLRPVDGIM